MKALKKLGLAIAGITCLSGALFAQNAISTKAGTINVADGDVYIGDRLYTPKPSEVTNVPQGEILRTSEGRAEVLLTPGAFLRMPEDSSFRLVNNSLTYVVLEVLRGSVLVEVTELLPENNIRVKVADAIASPLKAGLYRIDAEPTPRIRVFEGEAEIQANDQKTILKGSRELVAANGTWTAEKFDPKETDALYRWAKRRSEYVAMANLSSARLAPTGSGPWGNRSGSWAWNSYFGTMTYLPFANSLYSPFGYAFFNPYTVYRVYAPRPISNPPAYAGGGNGGFSGPGFARGPYHAGSSSLPGRSATASYGGSSSPSAGAPSAPSGGGAGSAPRGGGDSGARGGAGGGRGQ